MKILQIKIDWREKYITSLPEFQLLVDATPDHKSLIHEEIAPMVYYCEMDGYVSFFVGPGGSGALGGYVKDGKYLGGAWSSRAGYLNKLPGIRVVDVSLTDDPENYKRGYTFRAGHVTASLLKEAAKMAEISLARCVDSSGEITFQPMNNDASIGPEGIKNTRHYNEIEELK